MTSARLNRHTAALVAALLSVAAFMTVAPIRADAVPTSSNFSAQKVTTDAFVDFKVTRYFHKKKHSKPAKPAKIKYTNPNDVPAIVEFYNLDNYKLIKSFTVPALSSVTAKVNKIEIYHSIFLVVENQRVNNGGGPLNLAPW